MSNASVSIFFFHWNKIKWWLS